MNLVDEVLSRVNIVDYISRFVNLRKSGSNYTGICPFHSEKTPSFMVSEDKQIFKCFGCGQGGNVITFAMEYDRLDFKDAIVELANYASIDAKDYERKSSQNEQIKDEKEKLKSSNLLINQYFANKLQDNQSAQDYIYKHRKLTSEIINRFGLGYAPDNQYDMINFLASKGISSSEMYMTGLIRQGNSGDNYSFFRNRITFPIYDTVNNIVGFTSRIINPEDNPKYLNISETPLFNKSKILYGLNIAKQYIKEHNRIIVVEGNMDVIALYRIGLPIGVATCGTSLSQDHVKTLSRHTHNIQLLFDNDGAGFAATIRAVKLCLEQDIYPQILHLEKPYKDVDDLANDDKLDDLEKRDILTHTSDAISYIYTQLNIKHNISNPVEKKILINEMFDILSYIQDPTIRSDYIYNLSDRLGSNPSYMMTNYKTRISKNKYQNTHKETKTNNTEISKDTIIFSIFEGSRLHQIDLLDSQIQNIEKLHHIYIQICDIVGHPKPTKGDNDIKMSQLQLESQTSGQANDKIYIYLQAIIKNQCEYIYKLYFKKLEGADKIKILPLIKEIQMIK